MTNLPPLPNDLVVFTERYGDHLKLKALVSEYGALCRKQALEEVAKILESTQLENLPTPWQGFFAEWLMGYAKAIRELLK